MQYAYEDDTLLGLEKARKGRKPRRWRGSLPQRIRASKKLPQAVFKISSYSHSAGAVWDRVTYVARDGELEVEAQDGEALDQVELEAMVDKWEGEAAHRKRGVLAMSAVVSFPAGVDREKATEAARQFFGEAFGRNHDYVFAPHNDAKQFHVHIVVQARGHDGTQLRITKEDIQDLRMLLAEKAREQGIELDASPRWARGEEREPHRPRAVEGIERRGEAAVWEPPNKADALQKAEAYMAEMGERVRQREGRLTPDRQAAWDALTEERAKRRDPDAAPCQALEYARAAATLAANIPRLEHDTQKVAAVKGTMQLAAFSWNIPSRETDTAEEIEEARGIVNRAVRAVHEHIQGIESGAAKKEAIQAERALTPQLKEYRQEQREKAAEERKTREAAEERDEGPELER